MSEPMPYRIAVLCYLFDAQDQVLLLHRFKAPNQHLYSPVGGKLDQATGESPTVCALREIREETGLDVPVQALHLTGIVSESGFEDAMHWLMFLYEVTRPVDVQVQTINEGHLGWYRRQQLDTLAIPQTDRQVIWPLFWRYRRNFFTAHIACAGGQLTWRLEQPGAHAHQAGTT